MPLFEYRCTACGNVFELFKKFCNADSEEGTECPLCGEKSSRQIALPHFVKGPGYWADTK